MYHPHYQTIVVCAMAEEGRDISTATRQLRGKCAILAASLCRVGTRGNENPRCVASSKPSRYVSMLWCSIHSASFVVTVMARKLHSVRPRIHMVLRGSASGHQDCSPIVTQKKRVMAAKYIFDPG